MYTSDQKRTIFTGPCFALRFLLEPNMRDVSREGMQGFSDSAVFHRLHDLFWTFEAAETLILLSQEEKKALDEFVQVFDSLAWRVVEFYPHISELPDDDLTPLIPAGEQLYRLLQARI